MAIYTITASQDTSIYEKVRDGIYSSSMNTGLDEILEIRKDISGSMPLVSGSGPFNSRTLIQFDLPNEIRSGSSNIGKPLGTPTTFLKLYSANKDENLAFSDEIELDAISQSWLMGSGRFTNEPITREGCTWLYPENENSLWTNCYGEIQYGGSTHSIAGQPTINQVYGPQGNGAATNKRTDLRLDVTYWIRKMTASSGVSGIDKINNNGFLIRRERGAELNNTKLGSLKFFSNDTHTIYQPRLEFCWDESSWSTSVGTISITEPQNLFVYLKNNTGTYRWNTKPKFRIVAREKYPTKTYGNTSANLTVKVLPSGSAFYSVKDLKTGETVIPYDLNFGKISADSEGNYFEIYTKNLSPERYYQIEVKLYNTSSYGTITTGSVPVAYYPIKDVFKVVR
tara:strand:- start:5135 stop:6325 length:1191 start_codon:yes stop_codon:yes gene_type:complete